MTNTTEAKYGHRVAMVVAVCARSFALSRRLSDVDAFVTFTLAQDDGWRAGESDEYLASLVEAFDAWQAREAVPFVGVVEAPAGLDLGALAPAARVYRQCAVNEAHALVKFSQTPGGKGWSAAMAELQVAQDATFAARCALADIALGARPVAHCTGGNVEIF